MTGDPTAVDAAARLLGGLARRDVPIGPLTTYRVGGAAALFVTVEDTDDLRAVGAAVAATGIDVLVVGNGSNLLVADEGFAGLALVLGDAHRAVDIDGTTVTAGGAALLPVVARQTVAAGLAGFAWAVGVPGTIGGAVRMNAGGHGSDMAATLAGVRVFDTATGEDVEVSPSDLHLGYRTSSIGPRQVVLAATLALHRDETGDGADTLSEIVRWRRANQPGGQNAGSVFTNPPDDSAGRLIDEAGCKGLRIGTAAVSDKHANFIQADPDGRAGDVLALMVEVRDRVAVATGIRLHAETRLAGFTEETI